MGIDRALSTSPVPADQLEDAWQSASEAPDWDRVFGVPGNRDGWSQFDLPTRLELSEIDLEWRWRSPQSEMNRYTLASLQTLASIG